MCRYCPNDAVIKLSFTQLLNRSDEQILQSTINVLRETKSLKIQQKKILKILKECKDCKQDHTENCIINVIRNCYEVGLFGDIHPFEGSVFQYLMYLNSQFPEKSAQIAQLYKS